MRVDNFARENLPPREHWPEFRLDDLGYPERLNCVTELLDAWLARGHGARPAMGTPDETWSYADLAARVNRIAGVLTRQLGVAPGNRVLLRAPNTPMLVAATLAVIIAGILIGYWALLRFFPVPGFGPARYDSLGYLGAYIDRAVFTTRHLWPSGLTPGYGVTYDSEGLLSTLPAIANTLLGVLAGVWLRMPRPARSKVADLLFFGALLFLVAWPLSSLMPINKRIWTSTFALLSGGVSLLSFGLLYWILDLRFTDVRATDVPAEVCMTGQHRLHRWMKPAITFACIFGTNAILAFVLSSVITASFIAIRVHVAGTALEIHQAAYQYLFFPWLPPRIASLAYALAIVALNAALLYPLYRRRIFLRV